jgi:ubiquinone/menaquinone biosynthesis C-methylase UbiE
MPTPDSPLDWYQTFISDEQQRKNWYAAVAKAYDRLRPKYTKKILDRVAEVAGLSIDTKILEIGCGPGTATIDLAKMGFSIVALEPSLETYEVARKNLISYPKVEIVETNFEEWTPTDRSFDAILAATSWHWVAPALKHLKAASILKDQGALILLWNTAMQPSIEIFQQLSGIFQEYVPTLSTYKDRDTQLKEIGTFADAAIASLLFSEPIEDYQPMEVIYPIEDYLQLLTTYSPCIALPPTQRQDFLDKLRQVLTHHCGEKITLSYLSVFHIIRKL